MELWTREEGYPRFRARHRQPVQSEVVPLEQRIATFDQDGALWVEHPMHTQVVSCLERLPVVVKAKPQLANVEPFKPVLSGHRDAIAKLTTDDLFKILGA